MNKQLTGKIFWVEDDFNYNNCEDKNDEHIVAKIENVIIDDDGSMIQFHIPDPGYLGQFYNVNLINNGGFNYKSYIGGINITCEKFSNDFKHFLYGTWIEDE